MPSTPGIDAASERSDLVREALDTARRAHAGQLRRGSDGLPFVEHPIAVAELLATHEFSDEALAAALLHDVLENSEIEAPELRQRFGDVVTELVLALTEDKTIEDYEERKAEHRRRISRSGEEAMAIFAADKRTNVETLRDAYALIGERVSEELAVSIDLKIYIWEGDLEMLFNEAPDMELVDELSEEMVNLWGDRFRAADAPSD